MMQELTAEAAEFAEKNNHVCFVCLATKTHANYDFVVIHSYLSINIVKPTNRVR